MLRSLLLLVSIGCKGPAVTPTDPEADADTDTDADADADADTDTDTDTDTDADTDADVDVPCVPDDVNEPNDIQDDALPVAGRDTTALLVCDTSDDHWLIEVPSEQALEVTLTFTQADGDLDLLLRDPQLDQDLAIGQSETDDESVLWVNPFPFNVPTVARVYGYSGAANTYDLTTVFHDCAVDANEPDDDPAHATDALEIDDRTVDASPDVFSLGTIDPEDALAIDLTHETLLGDVQIELMDVDEVVLVTFSSPGLLEWNNPASEPFEVFARISRSAGFCGKYGFNATVLTPELEICDDHIDNDLDGLVDCDDYTCIASPACPAGCPLDDSGEPNDVPNDASALPQAVDHVVHAEDPDWYLSIVGAGEYANVELSHPPIQDGLRVTVLDDHGSVTVQQSTDASGDAVLEWINSTDDTITYRVGVEVDAGGVCTTYDLTSATGPVPPEVCTDGHDNDVDGATDCFDYDCLDHPSCAGVCPHEDLLEDYDTAEDAQLPPDGLALMVHRQDPDWFSVDLAPDEAGAVTMANLTAGADLDLRVEDEQGVEIASAMTANPTEQVVWANTTGSTLTYRVQVLPAPGAPPCGGYDLATSVAPIEDEICDDMLDNDFDGFTDCEDYSCLGFLQCVSTCPLEDSYEDNDTAAHATPDPDDVNFMVHPQDVDWFTVSLMPDEAVTTQLSYNAGQGNLALRITDEEGFVVLDSDDATDIVEAQWNNPTQVERAYFLEMRPSDLGNTCNRYNLSTEVRQVVAETCVDLIDDDGDGAVDCEDADCIGESPTCGCGTDVFDGNHHPTQAANLPPGTTPDLVVPVQGGDWFSTTVGAGETLVLRSTFISADNDVGMALVSSEGEPLAEGVTSPDQVDLSWTNDTAQGATVLVVVTLGESSLNPFCGSYTLEVL